MNTHSIRKLIFCLVILLTASLLTHAQPAFPPTADESCYNCVPDGYTKVDNSYSPAISSPNYYGELISNWVSYNGQNVPPPPSKYSQNLGYITHRFVTLQSFNNAQGNVQEKIQAVVSGFKPNKSYSFTYSVLSSAVPNTTFGKSAKMTVTTPPLGGGLPGIFITDQETTFGLQRNIWITKTLTFVASAETLVFTLSAGEMDAGSIGFVNFDIDNYPFACKAGSTDVPISQTNVGIACPSNTYDLTTLIPSPPAGMENVWYTDAIHTPENKVNDPTAVPVGEYYLFRYDPTFECFNVQQSNSKVEVKALGNISLKNETATNSCPETSVNLTNQVNGPLPLSHIVRWFTTKDRSTQAIFSPVVSTNGKYYAFLYNFSSGCYYKDIAEDSVDVTINVPCCQTGTDQVKLSWGTYNIGCGQTANLNSLLSVNNNIPLGTEVVWYTTKNHAAGTIVNTPDAVTVGKYYAFIYDGTANCFNTDNSSAEVSVIGVNGFQVPLDQTTLINQCPSKTVNLHNSYSVNPLQGQGFQIVFYKTADHTGGPVLANVNTTGTYYAFFFNSTTGCFNTDNSEAEVEVVIVDCTPCAVTGSDQVDLKTDSKSNLCPAATVDLYSTIQNGAVPAGTEVVWFDNPYHWGTPLTVAEASAISSSKTYYAFLHDIIDIGCYNTGVSTSLVNVTINTPCPPVCNAGSSQVNLKPGGATNDCPSQTVNLNDYFENILPGNPPGLKYVWFDNADRNGLPLTVVNKIATDGQYYAFVCMRPIEPYFNRSM